MPDRQDGQNKRITRGVVQKQARIYFNLLMQRDFHNATLVNQSDLPIEVEKEDIDETEVKNRKGSKPQNS